MRQREGPESRSRCSNALSDLNRDKKDGPFIVPEEMCCIPYTDASRSTCKPQLATPSLPSRPSLGRLALVTSSGLTASSNDGGCSYGGGATTSVVDGGARGVKVNSSSGISLSARSRFILLPLAILAYNTKAKKSKMMVPMLTPAMSPVYLRLDENLSRSGGW